MHLFQVVVYQLVISLLLLFWNLNLWSSPICEPCHHWLRLLDLLLCFHSSVEDWAISTLAKYVLVERSLTPLALYPQIAILLLVQFKLLFSLDVDLLHSFLAIEANYFRITFEQVLAAQARLLHLSELEEACHWLTHWWNVDVASVLTGEQSQFWIA